ncbi:MAG TPA: hypothetical protein VLG47_01480 [Candidatus Saccharimonadales bacterium]|nr:hypothetical protein [Candidatus Saccharimonadales bacterium]
MAKRNDDDVSGWVGWQYFAASLMMLAGVFQFIAGLVALFKDQVFLVAPSNLILLDYTQWGWVHLLIGVVLFLTSFSLFAGNMWGRTVGIVLAALSAIANFTFLQAYPWWSLIVIILDVLIIYAIAVHGGEVKED